MPSFDDYNSPLDNRDSTNTPNQVGHPAGCLLKLILLPILISAFFVWMYIVVALFIWVGGYISNAFWPLYTLGPIFRTVFSIILYLLFGLITFIAPVILLIYVSARGEEEEKEKLQQRDKNISKNFERIVSRDHSVNNLALMLRPFKSDFQNIIARPCLTSDDEKNVLENNLYVSKRVKSIDDLLASLSKDLSLAFPRANFVIVGERTKFTKNSLSSLATDDDQWKDVVLRLLEKANVVFLLPDVSEGVRFEIDAVCSTYLDKVIFIEPPSIWYSISSHTGKNGPRIDGYDLILNKEKHEMKVAKWRGIRDLLRQQYGLDTPTPSINGCLFWYENRNLNTCLIPMGLGELRELFIDCHAFWTRVCKI